MEKYIYKTHETWGDETYFFTEQKYNEFMDGMKSCRDGNIEEPERFDLVEESGLYEGKFHNNFGREQVTVTDWSDPSNLQVEYVN